MRRYLWSGLAAVLALALGLYSAASYAGRHPHSILGRFAKAVYHAGFHSGSTETGCSQSCCRQSAEQAAHSMSLPIAPEPVSEAGPAVRLLEPIHVAPSLPTAPPEGREQARFLEIIPAVADAMDDCPTIMPRCCDETAAPPLMPIVTPSGVLPAGCLDDMSIDPYGLYWLDLEETRRGVPQENVSSEDVN